MDQIGLVVTLAVGVAQVAVVLSVAVAGWMNRQGNPPDRHVDRIELEQAVRTVLIKELAAMRIEQIRDQAMAEMLRSAAQVRVPQGLGSGADSDEV